MSFDTEELDRDIAWLRAIVFWVVVGLLLLSAGVNIIIWRQVQSVRAQITANRQQIDEYTKIDPEVRELVRQLNSFAATNPDFQKIMAKYAPVPTNALPAKK